MTDAKTLDADTSTRIASILAAEPIAEAPVGATFAEFIAWATETGRVSTRLLAFLGEHGGLAGATPAAYQHLTRIGETEWFKALPGETRRLISTSVLGEPAMDAYVAWMLSKAA